MNVELSVGDLCMYVGEEVSVYTRMMPRVIYRVVSKVDFDGLVSLDKHTYGLCIVFDVAGHDIIGNTYYCCESDLLKKLDLIELGLLRLALDDFINTQVVKWNTET